MEADNCESCEEILFGTLLKDAKFKSEQFNITNTVEYRRYKINEELR